MDAVERKFQKELNAGVAALLLLSSVEAGPMYGYQIAKRIDALAKGALPMKLGALYPVLHSLQRSGLVISKLAPSESGPPRRYYHITGKGRTALARWVAAWTRTRDLVEAALGASHESSR